MERSATLAAFPVGSFSSFFSGKKGALTYINIIARVAPICSPLFVNFLCSPIFYVLEYLLKTEKSRFSMSFLRRSRSFGARTGVRFSTVMVLPSPPNGTVFFSVLYFTALCIPRFLLFVYLPPVIFIEKHKKLTDKAVSLLSVPINGID